MNYWQDQKTGRSEIATVTIEKIDQAILDYFQKRLNLTVDSPTGRKTVPVIYATGERAFLIRDKKGLRDENKTLILPLVTIQRLDIDRSLTFGGAALEVPSITVSKTVHKKTNILQNLIEQRNKNGFPQPKKDKVIYEVLTIPFPDFATVYYQIMIWAQFQTQMNEMLEKIFYSYDHMDSFVIPTNYDKNDPSVKGKGYYFVGFRETDSISAQNNFEEFTDDERIIRYQYNVRVPIYLILDPKDKPVSYGKEKGGTKTDSGRHVVYKQQTIGEVNLSVKNERVLTAEEASKLFDLTI